MKNYDRVWATVDLDAVKYNICLPILTGGGEEEEDKE